MNKVRGRDRVRFARPASWPAAVRLLILLVSASLFQSLPSEVAAQPIAGELNVSVANGFARLEFKFAQEVASQARVANNILTITFERPVDVKVDRTTIPDYVSAARRDPDGKAIRFALVRNLKMNSITAGERLFVDLMPEDWKGLPPGLPRSVIDELARRAREAEKHARQQELLAKQKQMAPIRLRFVRQPTFIRYIFDLPELMGVSADKGKDKLTLTFDGVLKFDLADALAALPHEIRGIKSEVNDEQVLVRFNFSAKVDVRTFREDNTYVVDITPARTAKPQVEGAIRSDELAVLANALTQRKKGPSAAAVQQQATSNGKSAGTARTAVRSSNPTKTRDNGPAPSPASNSARDVPPKPPAAKSTAGVQARSIPRKPAPPMPSPQPMIAAGAASAEHPEAARLPRRSVPESPGKPGASVKIAIKRKEHAIDLVFPFREPTPAAVFRRGDVVWLVFDTGIPINVGALNRERNINIRRAIVTHQRNLAIVRLKLDRPQLIGVSADGPVWTITLANEIADPAQPLAISRNIVGRARSSIFISIDKPARLHRIPDDDAGDWLFVITALAPARGLLKQQDFVEFRALATVHGVALEPLADDLGVELAPDKIMVTRPNGLSLSAALKRNEGSILKLNVLDPQSWGFDRQANFEKRKSLLMRAAASAPDTQRLAARCDLARFFLAKDMYAEAKGVLDVALADNPPTSADSSAAVLRAIANILLGRADDALKELANPVIGNRHDAMLWRAFADARLGKWSDAREGFRQSEMAMNAVPLELQRAILLDMIRAFIETGDVTGATRELNDFELIGIPHELEPAISVLRGRLAEALGRVQDALRDYRAAIDSWDRRAAAQGRLREILLQQAHGKLPRSKAISDLESLTMIWRGDDTEVEALQLLAHLYTRDGRYRDAFHVMRTALQAHPNSDLTRRIQDEAAKTFDSLFLAGKGDGLPAIDALALFYDFRELTPIGRRGDEMIRRLADRLVSVDLLYQASELLQYQVDHRLEGAARAQVAARLAVVYLMDRRPARALAVLRATHIAELNNDLRNQRLLLEARALSEIGQHDVALEVIANIKSREATRLRSDILWKARRWDAAAEQIELALGERWRNFTPLNEAERSDVMRGAIGYALAGDSFGLMRFREKYAAKMGEGADRRAFDVVTAPIGTGGSDFSEIAHTIASVDTLEAFLRDMEARYPATGPVSAQVPASPASNETTSHIPPKLGAPATRPASSARAAVAG